MANPLDSEPELVPFADRDEKEWLQSGAVSSADKERLLAELRRRLTVWRANLKPSREQLLQVTHEENRIHARLDGGSAQFWEGLDADWRRKQKPVDWQPKEEWWPKAREWLDMERRVARIYNSEKEAGDAYVASQRPPFAAPSEAQVSRDRIMQMRMVGLRPDPEDVENVLRDDLEYQRALKEKAEKIRAEFQESRGSKVKPETLAAEPTQTEAEILSEPKIEWTQTRKQQSRRDSGNLAASNQRTNRFWTEIKKHPGWYLVAFLLSGLPVGIGTIWPILTHETLPEWLAEHGLPRLPTLVAFWLGGVAVIVIVIIVRSYRTARHADSYQTNSPPKLEPVRPERPSLAGRIDCLEVDVDWDTERFGIDEENRCRLKVAFTLRATLLNESTVPTTISGLQMHVLWKDGSLVATESPVENYSVVRGIPRSDGEWGDETVSRSLVSFRQDVEITNTNHQSGDLRFLATGIPSAPESTDERPIVRDDVIIRLEALDRKRERHNIYEGTWNGLPECGSIVRTAY